LNGAHDSLVNVKAQTDIFVHPSFIPYVDRKPPIQPIDQIFSASEQNAMKRTMEPTRHVHAPWTELSKDDDVTWESRGRNVYTGSAGGGLAGPISRMKEAARNSTSLADLFLFIVPLSFFQTGS